MTGLMMDDYYYTIEKPAIAEFKDKGSKFIAYVFPVTAIEDIKQRLGSVKKEHPKATHHCFAWRIGTDGNNFRVNDDGEPSGSAGRPILGQIDSKRLTNVLVIVVRYFGGTLLGVPGLINAYKTSASLALQMTPVIKKPVTINYRLQFDYTIMNEVMVILKKNNCSVIKQESQLFSLIEVAIPKDRLNEAMNKLKSLRLLSIEKF